MPAKSLLCAPQLSEEKTLKTLVENRVFFSLENCELNIFETYQKSQMVPLKFDDLVVTSMLRGKKRMHLFNDPSFEYLPGETVIVPKDVEMKIDFPEACKDNPTQCIALAIDNEIILNTLDFLNEKYPKLGEKNIWKLNQENYFFYNNIELASIINKLIKECMSTSITKDVIADLALQELIIRLVQTQTSQIVESKEYNTFTSPISPAISFIKSNFRERINLKDLSDKACMSTSSFYRYFKRELGMSPIEFILNEKIKFAKQMLVNPRVNVNEVSYATGFEDCNYFIRLFKKHEGITPKQYQIMNFQGIE